MAQDQKHPKEKGDRLIVNELLVADPTDYNLAELARLRIRYGNFPGARQLTQDLDFNFRTMAINRSRIIRENSSPS
ncbi:hypothetical protein CWATWH0401_1305 [Crocosphaera watsonii WH 0401]|uniref:Uncharacterized protein n=1 Tax=Crocosphaera watsonii WH 0401 TaxID=555881 RepID=T2J972_CROWT|nr:hypothetical protein CWATWH0401_1305 [Crocosphaera watsonii WH 0401]